jgi:sarcosine oxidase
MDRYEVIVLGLGAMGSAALYQLARAGAKVLGVDQFTPPHTQGSSHGQTRIIREAYYEHPSYVPIVQRAYDLWDRLEKESGSRLFLQTGGVMIGPRGSAIPEGALLSAVQHGLEHEVLEAAEIHRRWPALSPSAGMVGVVERRAGILFPEECIATHLRMAAKPGAETRLNERVREWSATSDGVQVRTSQGEYAAAKLIISAGAWLPALVPPLAGQLKVERQVLMWFAAKSSPETFHPSRCPIHLWSYDDGRLIYGFPDLGTGIKIAKHHEGARSDPDQVDRTIHPEEVEEMRALLDRFLPEANGRFLEATVCMYTDTPDQHFLIDFHPEHGNVLIVSPCSGHGFKFSSAVGEIAAELIARGKSRFDIGLFALNRLR